MLSELPEQPEQPNKLLIKTIVKSKAKFFRVITLKSFIAGEPYEISFKFENIGGKYIPSSSFSFSIRFNQQIVWQTLVIPTLKKNEVYVSEPFNTDALSEGYDFVNIEIIGFIDYVPVDGMPINIYTEKNQIKPYTLPASIYPIKVKSWEEIYEFWAMIISAISLFIIAIEKINSFF